MSEQNHVEQLFTAIARRDPSKRQIKPVVDAHFDLLDDLDDESDEEFVCEESDEDSDGDESDDDDSIPHSNSSSSNSSSEKTPDKLISCEEKSQCCSNDTSRLSSSFIRPETDIQTISNAVPPKSFEKSKTEFLVCLLCLGDKNEPEDELIECDGCGIVVHEDCYKVIDSVFLSSGNSSSSTDAWFCEPCLAGVRHPACELCPILSGAFKRTDNNRWVHLLCALYTPGVAFNDAENLTDVTLTELPSKLWSSHECSLCEEPFFSWTGVCISCDAGLCRTYFHVTCAQKQGLLSEPNLEENNVDPYFAQCRQHTDKSVARHRRRNYLTAMSRLKLKSRMLSPNSGVKSVGSLASPPHLNGKTEPIFLEPRLQHKLEHFRQLYEELRKVKEKPYVPTAKTPLYLEHSPVAMRLFVAKSKALQLPLNLTGESTINETNKAPPSGYPVFAPDFITYFFDREKKIDELLKRISSLQDTQRELQIADASASHSYNSVAVQLDAINAKRFEVQERFREIITLLKQLIPEIKPSSLLEPLLQKPDPKPEAVSCVGEANDSRCTTGRKRPLPSRAISNTSAARNRSNKQRISTTGTDNNDDTHPSSNTSAQSIQDDVILECFSCHGFQDQHLITKCDTCGKAFHLACLDPPMTRMPKRSKLYGWQCSYCTKAVATNAELITVDVNAPRQLRRSTGKPNESTQAVPSESHAEPLKVEPEADVPLSNKAKAPLKNTRRNTIANSKLNPRSQTARCRNVKRALNRFSPTAVVNKRFKSVTKAAKLLAAKRTEISGDQLPVRLKNEPPELDAYAYRPEDNSDEDIAGLRASKVIKFEQIRDQSHHNESNAVEQIAPLHMRYMICQESTSIATGHRKPMIERFRMKLKKL